MPDYIYAFGGIGVVSVFCVLCLFFGGGGVFVRTGFCFVLLHLDNMFGFLLWAG